MIGCLDPIRSAVAVAAAAADGQHDGYVCLLALVLALVLAILLLDLALLLLSGVHVIVRIDTGAMLQVPSRLDAWPERTMKREDDRPNSSRSMMLRRTKKARWDQRSIVGHHRHRCRCHSRCL